MANSLNEPMRDSIVTDGLSARNPAFPRSSSSATIRPTPRLRARWLNVSGGQRLERAAEQALAVACSASIVRGTGSRRTGINQPRHRRGMREGAADDGATGAVRRERSEVRVRPPPLGPPVERHRRAEEEHAPGRRRDGSPPTARPSGARASPPPPGALARPRPECEPGLVRAPGQRQADRQRDQGGDGRGARAPRRERRIRRRRPARARAAARPPADPRVATNQAARRPARRARSRRASTAPGRAASAPPPRGAARASTSRRAQRTSRSDRLRPETAAERREARVRPGERQRHLQVRQQGQQPDRGQPEPRREDERGLPETTTSRRQVKGRE